MEATALRTTCAASDCGENVPSKSTVTACPILSATPHSARRPLAEMSTSVALKPGGEMRRPLIDGTADAGRRGAAGEGTVVIYESSGGDGSGSKSSSSESVSAACGAAAS